MEPTNTPQSNKAKRDYWSNVINAWKASGKSQVQYCEENGIKASTFGYWNKELMMRKNLLIPVKVQESKPADPIVLRIETPHGLKIFVPCAANIANLSSIFKLLGVIQ